ncbi:MAG: heat-inducible transcriptional repressor HrcA, partial [Eubacteriales bacterium]
MEMNERKRKILHTIINEYVTNAEPVGSRHIAKNLDLGLSSATIRNEMADLEEMGYLEQPHTSAGRVPSDKGYRFYVNELMNGYEVSQRDIDLLAVAMEMKLNQFDKVIRQASVVLSQLTNYTAVLMTPEMKHGAIKTIELVPVDASSMLIILVTNEGIMKNKRVYIPKNVDHK